MRQKAIKYVLFFAKINKAINIMRCHYYSWRDGVVFEKGYEYNRIKSSSLLVMERIHAILEEQGWRKVGNGTSGFSSVSTWYRKPVK